MKIKLMMHPCSFNSAFCCCCLNWADSLIYVWLIFSFESLTNKWTNNMIYMFYVIYIDEFFFQCVPAILFLIFFESKSSSAIFNLTIRNVHNNPSSSRWSQEMIRFLWNIIYVSVLYCIVRECKYTTRKTKASIKKREFKRLRIVHREISWCLIYV